MKAITLLLMVFVICAFGETLILQPDNGVDTYVSQDFPYDNYGEQPVLKTGNEPGDYQTFLWFDVSAVPYGSHIEGAKLEIYCEEITGYFGTSLSRSFLISKWQEHTVTWTTRPDYYPY